MSVQSNYAGCKKILPCVISSRHRQQQRPINAIVYYRDVLNTMVATISRSLLNRIALVLIRAMHSPKAAFQTYLDENPWSLEARIYDT
jgi:hypothetical protein